MSNAPTTHRLEAAAIAAARILLSGLFLYEAWFKLTHYAQAVGYAETFGIPAAMLPLALMIEAGGGLLVLAGLKTRIAALALTLFCISTAILFHSKLSDGGEVLHFGKDLGLAGGFLLLVVSGAGSWSLDARRLGKQAVKHCQSAPTLP